MKSIKQNSPSKYFLLALITVFAGTFLIQNYSKTTQPNTSKNVDITKNWKVLNSKIFTHKYPVEAKGEVRENETLIFFMGQKQINSGRTQTELFDGYTFRIGPVDNPEKNLEAISKKERQNAVDNCNNPKGEVSELKKLTISNKTAFQYSATNCYIDYTETFVEHNGNTYRISQSYVGDTEDYVKYKNTTDQILQTLEFN